ncbi:MAG: sugar transferase [Planctomycetaceae bacterium]|jgi:lipopolysaccharide/colanic/teichoic acid biosynthesis glycosyltransferase|nr:sugar transferase [Planctomycetaceae bacterium]
MLQVPEPAVSSWFHLKGLLDIPLSVLLVIPALPIMLAAVIIVKLTSKGPGIYKQVRSGINGKVFTIYKIRSMRANAEAATGAVWCARKDNRITAVGKIIRTMHIDELPQLFNVIRGDMSLVGPRPERPEFVSELEKRIDVYAYRLNVKPGITGLAQLNQASDVDLNDVRRKLVYDFEYIEHASPIMDLMLIFCTSLKVVKMCNPFVLSLFRLRRSVKTMPWAAVIQAEMSNPLHGEERLSRILLKQT